MKKEGFIAYCIPQCINLKHFILVHQKVLTKNGNFYVPFTFMSGKILNTVRFCWTIKMLKDVLPIQLLVKPKIT